MGVDFENEQFASPYYCNSIL